MLALLNFLIMLPYCWSRLHDIMLAFWFQGEIFPDNYRSILTGFRLTWSKEMVDRDQNGSTKQRIPSPFKIRRLGYVPPTATFCPHNVLKCFLHSQNNEEVFTQTIDWYLSCWHSVRLGSSSCDYEEYCSAFWNVTPCNPVEVHWRLLLFGYMLGLLCDPQDRVSTFLWKGQIHGVILCLLHSRNWIFKHLHGCFGFKVLDTGRHFLSLAPR